MTTEEKRRLILEAQELGVPTVTIDGITYAVPIKRLIPFAQMTDQEISKAMSSPLDELTDEDVLYYATPYFDELQAKKEEHKKHIEERNNG